MPEPEKPQARKSTPEEVSRGKTELEMGVVANQVVLKFPQPMTFVTFEPENARTVAENMARAAYEARYGRQPPLTSSEIIRDAKERFTEKIRMKLIQRVALMLNTESMMKLTPGQRAVHVVDQVMKEIA